MKTDRALLVILCGLPFSGKSTLARELAATVGAAHVEIDRINSERGIGMDGAAIGAEEWDATYAESFQLIERHLAAGQSVIHDATNYTREQRERLRTIANISRAETIIVYVELPEADVRRRWLGNRVSGQRYDVRDDDFRNVLERFEVPGSGEGVVIRLDGRQPPATLVRKLFIYHDCSVDRTD